MTRFVTIWMSQHRALSVECRSRVTPACPALTRWLLLAVMFLALGAPALAQPLTGTYYIP